jgi:tRNA dimethylallyltransferase
VSGRPLTDWQEAATRARGAGDLKFAKLALVVERRSLLHDRIERRLDSMVDAGFLDELRALMRRPGIDREGPAMRSVGYRQFWAYLAGECTFEEARCRALAATRQLAKRQITWLRAEQELECFDPLESGIIDTISTKLACRLGV